MCLNLTFVFRTPQNDMSQYPSYYIEPVFRKEKQNKLEDEGEISKIAHIPIRAAKVDQTCSIMHDDHIRYNKQK